MEGKRRDRGKWREGERGGDEGDRMEEEEGGVGQKLSADLCVGQSSGTVGHGWMTCLSDDL